MVNIDFKSTNLLFEGRYPIEPINWSKLDDYFSSLTTPKIWSKFKRWASQKNRFVFLDDFSSKPQDHFLYIRNHGLEHEVFVFDFILSEPYTLDQALQRIMECEDSQEAKCKDPNV